MWRSALKMKDTMQTRRNNYDVTNRIETTDPDEVNREVKRIFLELYPDASPQLLDRSFLDVSRLYHGEYPGYLACDTEYHNLQHTLDVTLEDAVGVMVALAHRHLREVDQRDLALRGCPQ